MNLIRSGVLVPVLVPLLMPCDGLNAELRLLLEPEPIVVIRCMFVVSALGGGGREERFGIVLRTEARHRKDSPVP